jgi:PAS domain S-box-containing protein
MRAPAKPGNEGDRLADLYDYGILDTETERIFDEIAELAAAICGTPIGAVTFIDRDRQWFKAEFGLDLGETTRDESICGHAILEAAHFEIEDTDLDARFSNNPLLSKAPGIRFYSGSQLSSSRGHAIGMLCVMDSKPRMLSPEQRKSLQHLADVVMAVVEAGRKSRLLNWFGALVNQANDEFYIIDPKALRYLHANRCAQERTGYSFAEILQLSPMVLGGDPNRQRFERYVERLEAGEPYVRFDGTRVRADGSNYPVEARWQLLPGGKRPVIVSHVQDISERRELERVKNEFISRVSQELGMARTMQLGLLPPPAGLLDLNFNWFFEPSGYVAGDTFDYFPIDEDHACFFMIDVSGHGVSSAMMAFSAQHQLRSLSQSEGAARLAASGDMVGTVTWLIAEFNRRIFQMKETSLYLTLVFGVWSRRDRAVTLVQAGHPPPLLLGAEGARWLGDGGLPIGITAEPEHQPITVRLARGDRLAIYSDGVTDCEAGPGGERFGRERLQDIVAQHRDMSLGELASAAGEALTAWSGGAVLDDDVSLLVIEAT